MSDPVACPPLMMWMLCCNDHHGTSTDKVEMATFDLGDHLVELEGPELRIRWCGEAERDMLSGAYRSAPHQLKVYGRGRLPVFRLTRHVGNIHWDQIGVPVPCGVALCNWLRRAGWSLMAGPCRLSEIWDRDDPQAVTEEALSRGAAS